ncbi:MAG TPA: GerMN domain-containing protein [Acidobacteriaceae bacterium]|nr:GerMN domain-containing protein [Acidobacteriaceae bacterium]
MISRVHKVLFLIMLLACVVMAAFLIRLRNRAQDRLHAEATMAPAEITEGSPSAPRSVMLYIPNDLDGSMTSVQRSIALPADDNAQARVLLDNLIAAFHAAGSTHPMSVETGVNEVYFLPLPKARGEQASSGRIAVVDLSGALAAAQPSGIEPETLTLLAMMATLHANMPSIAEVHFLVDGQPRQTLAGHADLTRTYLASEASPEANPTSRPGQAAEVTP